MYRRTPLQAIEAEARSPQQPLAIPLGDSEISVPPVHEWTEAGFHAAINGDHEEWARECLDDDSYDAWLDADPTLGECSEFFAEWADRSGQDLSQIRNLLAFLEEHAEAVEADLARYYHLDLGDLYRGGLTYRRLWVLIQRLPQESWTQTALRDEQEHELLAPTSGPQKFGPWRLDNYQLAGLADAIARVEFVLARVNGNESYPEPTPSPRPGMNRPVRIQSEAAVRYLRLLRENRGGEVANGD